MKWSRQRSQTMAEQDSGQAMGSGCVSQLHAKPGAYGTASGGEKMGLHPGPVKSL